MASPRSPEKHNRHQRIKSLKIIVETSDKNQYSHFYILNSFLKKAKKTMKWGQDTGPASWDGRGGIGTFAQLSLSMLAFASLCKSMISGCVSTPEKWRKCFFFNVYYLFIRKFMHWFIFQIKYQIKIFITSDFCVILHVIEYSLITSERTKFLWTVMHV